MIWMFLLLLCVTDILGCRSSTKTKNKYFSSSGWGSWSPNNNSWKEWIEKWGQENSSVAFDSTEIGREPESGWPTHWKGLGKGNAGVPPPPWAYVPENYGRPNFCYLQPAIGDCAELMNRWGFNPTNNDCQRFMYSGCGGNENNFRNRYSCMEACGRAPQTSCITGKINFRDYLDD